MNEYIRDVFANNLHLLQCPICKKNFSIVGLQLKCRNNHAFNFAKSGYVNYCNKSIKTQYGKTIFKARSAVIEKGFFNSLEWPIVKLLIEEFERKGTLTILDAGSGDGFLFSSILLSLRWEHKETINIGIDISKEGIQLASKNDKAIMWLVGDVANLPLQNHSVDIILNNLSPANYEEFSRVLKSDGLIIKSIPGKEYLNEIRKACRKNEYNNAKVIELFKMHNHLIREIKVFDKKQLTNWSKTNIMAMTPLTWNTDFSKGNTGLINELTIDLLILVGQKKKEY